MGLTGLPIYNDRKDVIAAAESLRPIIKKGTLAKGVSVAVADIVKSNGCAVTGVINIADT